MNCLSQTAVILLNIILPVFVLIGTGVLFGRFAKPDVRTLSHLNFYVFVPALVFAKILAKTPVIIAIVLALALRSLDASLPRLLAVPLDHLANGLIPVALVTLGVQLSRSGRTGVWQPLALATVLRLAIAPLLALAVVRVVGLEGLAAQVVTVAAGFPTAVNVYILASRYEEQPELASRIVFVTTLLSAVTVSLLLALVRGR